MTQTPTDGTGMLALNEDGKKLTQMFVGSGRYNIV
jgi:hypothetical protein